MHCFSVTIGPSAVSGSAGLPSTLHGLNGFFDEPLYFIQAAFRHDMRQRSRNARLPVIQKPGGEREWNGFAEISVVEDEMRGFSA